MKIVQLESYASNFDGLVKPEFFGELGDYTSYQFTEPQEVIERAKDAEILLINKTIMGEEQFAQLPKLRYVGVMATGWNVVDTEAAKRHGIIVTNVPAYSTESVAQLTFAHILNLMRGVETHAQANWSQAKCFTNCLTPQIELNSLTLGVFGFGAIGRRVAEIGLAFGMRVIAYSRTASKINLPGVESVTRDAIFRESDILTLHCPMTADTAKLINADTLGLMKQGSFLINTSRGGLLDEPAVAAALKNGQLGGAGLDVLSVEPPPEGHVLLHCPNCHISHHIAWATVDARMRLLNCAKENIQAFLSGKPQNVVS